MVDTSSLLQRPFSAKLQENDETIARILEKSADMQNRIVIMEDGRECRCYYFDGLADSAKVEEVVRACVVYSRVIGVGQSDGPLQDSITVDDLRSSLLTISSVTVADKMGAGIEAMLCGDLLLVVDGLGRALIANTRGWEKRSVEDPATESVVRGPRDGFTESIRVNTALMRRRIRDPMLRIDGLQIGERTRTDVNVAYIQGVVKEGLVGEVMQRLTRIRIDAILESGYIEELIEDSPMSPFATVESTERPDKVASALLEGRVAIFVDNTPFVLIVPTFFWQFLQASDDYYSRYWVGSFFRIVRYIAFIVSFTFPSIYVMLVSFHHEMIPTGLALTIASGKDVVPFPVLFEALLMEIAFELMREAGLRMPKPIGQAVSIVGSLIIGQAAVQAGLVSPFMVIVVAVTGISSFAIPNYAASFSIRLIRFPLLLASGWFGLLGFATVFFLVVLHALSIRSFGEPYLAPASPFRPSDQKDILLRMPWWSMDRQLSIAEQRFRVAPETSPDAPKKRSNKGQP
jgi:spore germination protein KA